MLAKLYVLLKNGDGPTVRDYLVTTSLIAFASAVAFSLLGVNISHTFTAVSVEGRPKPATRRRLKPSHL